MRRLLVLVLVWGCGDDPRRGKEGRDSADTDLPAATGSGTGGTTAPTPWRDVAAGVTMACAIDPAGQVHCWGQPGHALLTPPAGRFTSVSLGAEQACAVAEDGSLACWGTAVQPGAPVDAGWDEVGCGEQRCCARRGTEVVCWGEVPPNVLTEAEQLAVGGYHLCGLRAGRVRCDGPDIGGESRPPALEGVTAVASGVAHSCALVDGRAVCWGSSRDQRLTGSEASLVSLSCGRQVSCGLDAAGHAHCWGEPLGAGPVDSPPDDAFTEVSVGWHLACGLRVEGDVRCWGAPAMLEGWDIPR